MPSPARLVAMRADPEALVLLLEHAQGQVHLDVPVPARTAHGLHHVHALSGAGHPCAARPAPLVEPLLRGVRALGGVPRAVVVRQVPGPSFWLRVDGPDGPVAVDLDVLDAAALLMAHRLPVEVEGPRTTDWDAQLRALTDG